MIEPLTPSEIVRGMRYGRIKPGARHKPGPFTEEELAGPYVKEFLFHDAYKLTEREIEEVI
jgi:hypothetical protein